MPVMMYECDYCWKQFRDTPTARRRHLLGVVHQRAKALWYESLSCMYNFIDSQIDETHLFAKNGICNHFYYHPNKDLHHFNSQGGTGDLFGVHMGSSMGNLPPSLTPPPEGGYPPLAFIDWG